MRDKAKNLIYLDSGNYISLESLRVFYWGIIIIPIYNMIIGIAGKLFFPIVSTVLWSVLYWIFVLTVQSNRIKKTFELRFFVNGVVGTFISLLFWILFSSFSLASGQTVDLIAWSLIGYLLFSLIYVVAIILCVHKDVFANVKENSKTKIILKISAFFGMLLPCSSIIGMYFSRLIHTNESMDIEDTVIRILLIILMFIPMLAHINFVKYYYCKKYKIDCDEYGNKLSPKLERKQNKKRKSNKKPK